MLLVIIVFVTNVLTKILYPLGETSDRSTHPAQPLIAMRTAVTSATPSKLQFKLSDLRDFRTVDP